MQKINSHTLSRNTKPYKNDKASDNSAARSQNAGKDITIRVGKKDIGLRLDVFTSKELKFPRTQIQNLISSGHILLNGASAKSSRHIKENDGILINFPETIGVEDAENKNAILNIPIIYEDDDVLIINKPRGIVVHPDKKHTNNTVVDWAVKHYPPLAQVGDNLKRPGIVHRLDKETSGIMIIAKNQRVFFRLKKAFAYRLMKKKYVALVYGNFPENTKFIDLDIGRSPKKARQVAISHDHAEQKSIKTRSAKTEFKILKNFKHYTLIEAFPLSGRTHQIRVHLASTGHPVVGDKIYGKKFINASKDFPMCLHSQELTAPFLSGVPRKWTAPLPDDFEIALKEIND